MSAQTINKKDIDRFTLPSPKDEIAVPEVKNDSVCSSAGGNSFWQSNKGKIWMSAFGLLIALALIAGFLIYRAGIAKSNSSPPLVAIPPESLTPTPVAIDISQYRIVVLNGSGIRGEAAQAQGVLETAGFRVSSTGNADSLDYQKTVIQAKKDVPEEYLNKLKKYLEQSYVVSDTIEFSETKEAEVIIIIGRETVGE